MNRISLCDWLPARASKMEVSFPLGIRALSRKENLSCFAVLSHTINPLLTKLVRSRSSVSTSENVFNNLVLRAFPLKVGMSSVSWSNKWLFVNIIHSSVNRNWSRCIAYSVTDFRKTQKRSWFVEQSWGNRRIAHLSLSHLLLSIIIIIIIITLF